MIEANEVQSVVTPEFGQRVRVTQKYGRRKEGHKKLYYRKPFESDGVFIGLRTITNGHTDSDDGWLYWVPTEHMRVALVVFNQNQNPEYVPLDSIECAA